MAKENLIKNKALELCMEAGESVTPNRVNILDLLIENKDPLAAYEIKDMLGNTCEWVINNSLNDSNTMCKGLSFKNLIPDTIDNFPDSEIINGKTSVHQDIGFRIIKRY